MYKILKKHYLLYNSYFKGYRISTILVNTYFADVFGKDTKNYIIQHNDMQLFFTHLFNAIK